MSQPFSFKKLTAFTPFKDKTLEPRTIYYLRNENFFDNKYAVFGQDITSEQYID